MDADEEALRLDLSGAAFRLGAVEGRWRLVDIQWPHVFIDVFAMDGRAWPLRFDCARFPHTAPTAGPWDRARNAVLAHDLWPRGNGGRLTAVFRTDWKAGTALYLPCDRVTFEGHEGWVSTLPSKIWRPSAGLTQYLEQVHELLSCSDYAPILRAAS